MPPSPESRGPPLRVEKPPWEQPGCFRRDCEPHRAWLLCALVYIGVLGSCPLIVYCCGVATGTPVGVVMPLVALVVSLFNLGPWVMAGRDLARIRKGLMDPSGRQLTGNARDASLAALLFSWPATLYLWVLLVLRL